MMKLTSSAVLSIVLLAGASACSLGQEGASAAPPPTAPSTTTSTIRTPPKPVRVEAFQTPSGNIVCGYQRPLEWLKDPGKPFVRCDVLQANFTAPPQPADCEFDWGFSFALNPDGSSEFMCVSDAAGDNYAKPAAGTSVSIGSAVCAVEARSVRCVAEGTDGGLFLSPDRYEQF